MSDTTNDCGCCTGAGHLPGTRFNVPGLHVIDYRIGRHGEFNASMLARLASADNPALAGLRTRSNDDFAIALCDAGAVMFDVLSFYQERIAHESYLRTAVERRSVIELARLIGYQPSPGVAASTHLAFTLEESPGVPSMAAGPVTIGVGTRAQSVPGPDEQPQTFETVAPIVARVEWNAIPVLTFVPQIFFEGGRKLFVAGISTQVQAGDVILLVGQERVSDSASNVWDACVVRSVEVDNDRGFTCLTFREGFGLSTAGPPQQDVRAYVFRARTALFGHNAGDARMLRVPVSDLYGLTTGNALNDLRWASYQIQNNLVDLDGSYPKTLVGSWVLLAGGDNANGTQSLPGRRALMMATNVRHMSRSAYGLSGKITRVVPDALANSDDFKLEKTVAYAQSEELKLFERPLTHPVYADSFALARCERLLKPGQALACSGKRQRVRIVADNPALVFEFANGVSVPAKQGDYFFVMSAPLDLPSLTPVEPADLAVKLADPEANNFLVWPVMDRIGRRGTVQCATTEIVLQTPAKEDPVVSEIAFIATAANALQHFPNRTVLVLNAPLANVYDRASLAVCANLALATVGEAVSEIAGSGDASAASQRFLLRQTPLTYVSAATPSGRASTLEVRVDGQLWSEVPTLFAREPNEHVYALRQDDDERTVVQFGDGLEGARLPTGRDNLRFGYRKFVGLAGNLRAGQVTTLLSRPLGVRTVNNPVATTGGEDRESRDAARRNAPLTMLTLGRAVSLQDYADFARGFAGIAKADAMWTRSGPLRGIFLSIAGPEGAAVPKTSQTCVNLAAALRKYGDPLLPLALATYLPATFRLKARIKVVAAARVNDVLTRAAVRLRQYFSFAWRDFAQAVSIDEVMAVIQSVPGVEAVDVDQLYRVDVGPTPPLVPRLFALPPQELANGSITAAELLTLDAGPLDLTVMP